jgi:hypothetical protein
MKNKIYYLTRSYYPYQKGGGPLMRAGAVKYLQELGWNVIVVMPNYNSRKLTIKQNIIQIPFSGKHFQKISSLFERIGLYEDYLDRWVQVAFDYMKLIVGHNDVVFATSGGELGMIKLGSLLKEKTRCQFVVNFRDPLNYGYMNGLRRDKKPHIGRWGLHKKYISNSDLILTSSQYYADVLSNKFTDLSHKIKNNYFGYVDQIDIGRFQKKSNRKLSIAYAGAMGKTQSPEFLYEAWKKMGDPDIEIYFIGSIDKYKPLREIRESGVHLINFIPHSEFLDFMMKNIDVGYVSLSNDYYGACVPSKIYEYINLGLPMIGVLPNGDGKDIINKNKYGLASNYNDLTSLMENIRKLKDETYLNKVKKNILKDRGLWQMKHKIIDVSESMAQLIK